MASNGILLIHGAWHDHHCWAPVIPLIADAGITVSAVDLPGAGMYARRPASIDAEPQDADAISLEPSPNTETTQQQRTDAVISSVRELNAATGGRAMLVGHSLGGLTVSSVAEAIAQELSAAVYLTAMMLPPGMRSADVALHPASAASMIRTLFVADPAVVGTRRLNTRSKDPAYLERVRETFYGDLSDDQFANALAYLHPDEPPQVTTVPSPVTAERFGGIPRHYIECLRDNAITLPMQRELVRLMDEAIGGETSVHTMDCSHSPFYSQPEALARILIGIARG